MVGEVNDWRRRNAELAFLGTDTRFMVVLSRLQTRVEQ